MVTREVSFRSETHTREADFADFSPEAKAMARDDDEPEEDEDVVPREQRTKMGRILTQLGGQIRRSQTTGAT